VRFKAGQDALMGGEDPASDVVIAEAPGRTTGAAS